MWRLFSLSLVCLPALLGACASTPAAPSDAWAAGYSPPPFTIEGDAAFRARIRQALMMLSLADPASLDIVETHVGRIRQHEPSGMGAFETPPRMDLGATTVNASLTWLASVLVHESHHSRLYRSAKLAGSGAEPPYDAWGGFEAERACNQVQMGVLFRLAAPRTETIHLGLQDGRHGDMNGDGKLDWEDYRLRNW